jgi:D-xylose transport system permease protein
MKNTLHQFKHMLVLEFGKNVRQIVMLVVLVGICLGFSILSDGMFTTPRNLSNITLQSAATAVAAIGVVLVLVCGHIDLSIGSFVAMTGALGAQLMTFQKWATLPAILVILLCGIAVGAWQGYWVAYRRIPAFIVTLAGMQIYRGVALVLTGGLTISPMTNAFKFIGQGYLPGIFSNVRGLNDTAWWIAGIICIIVIINQIGDVRSRIRYQLEVPTIGFTAAKSIAICAVVIGAFTILGRHLGVPLAVVLMGLLAVVFNFMSYNTAFGRHVYAIGGNKEAAVLSGINIKRVTFIVFVIMGIMCAISGIIYAARINAATVSAGQNMEMEAIAAAIVGGTSTMGGEGSVFGAIIGALIMASINNGMSIMNLPPEIQYIAKGLVLLFAVWLDVATRREKK